MSRNDLILGLAALVLIFFSLTVALVVPRRNPGFPGRRLHLFTLVAILLVAGMLTSVEVFGAEEKEGEKPEAKGQPAETAQGGGTTAETSTGGAETGGGGQGNAEAGKAVFAANGCASCHTLSAAGASGTVGPNLDKVLAGKDAAFIEESIVNPDAEIAPGYTAGIMPKDFGEKLSKQELADLVAFLVKSAGG